MVNPATPVKDINALYIDAWKQGIKTLSNDAAKEFVIDDSFKEVNGNIETMEATATGIEEKQGHQILDDEKEMDALLKKLKENS